MAVILVSHDLGAVVGRTDRVAVMYAGRVAETARTAEVFARPLHPYSEALLASIPQLEAPPHTVLRTIAGRPPDMASPPDGCRFAPRCDRAQDRCRTETPLLRDPRPILTGTAHLAACHFPLSTHEEDQ